VDPAIGEVIKATALTGIYLTQVIEDRLSGFAKRFSKGNSATVEQAVKKARCENYTCKRKGNQHQLDHALQVLDKFDEASDALKVKSYDKVKTALEAGTEAVAKRIKTIRLADKSEFGWWTVNKYLSDELASDSDDGKNVQGREEGGEEIEEQSTETEEAQLLPHLTVFHVNRDLQPVINLIVGFSTLLVVRNHALFKISTLPLFFSRDVLALFFPSDLWRY